MDINDLKSSLKDKIFKYTLSLNIADELDDEELEKIARIVMDGLEEDEESMTDWLDDANKAMDLTDIKREVKNFPFPGAANTKYPMMTISMLQTGARSLSEFVKNGDVVKYRAFGSDPTGAKNRKGQRIKNYLNYQVLEEMPNWLDEREKLVGQASIIGTCYTKTYYDPIHGICKSKLVPYDMIKVNDNINSLEEAPRISEYFYLTRNDIIKNMRYGLYKEMPLEALKDDEEPGDKSFYEFVEQHTWLNLLSDDDEDELEQPYIVTIHKKSKKIVRIVARYMPEDVIVNDKKKIACIIPQHFYTDYHFIPNPRGRFHSIGYGTLMLDMNITVNSLLNQIINCGTLSMTQGGIYSKDAGLRPEDLYMEPGDWIPAETPLGSNLKDSFFPFSYNPPSPVLFQLLDTMVKAGKELTSSTDAMTGMQDATNVSPNTLYALIDQSEKVITANQRRLMRGLKKELGILYQLNRKYLTPDRYLKILNITPQEAQEAVQGDIILDFYGDEVDVAPIADSDLSSTASKLARVSAGLNTLVQAQQVAPGIVDPRPILRDAYDALNYENVDMIVPPPQPQQVDKDMVELQSQIDMRAKELELKAKELELKERELDIKARTEQAKAIKYMADADAKDKEQKLKSYSKVLDSELKRQELAIKEREHVAKSQQSEMSE